MPTDYKNIKKQFEKSMSEYDKNALVQNMMAEKLLIELVKIQTDFENILELGSGTGLTTRKIARKLKFKNYCANDLVEKSQNYVKKFIPKAKFICGNALKIMPSKKVDLIISNAMFQWFENLDNALNILKLSMNKGAILAFTSFSPENFSQIKNLTGLTLNYKSLEETENILKLNGFEILFSENFYEEIEFKNPLELLVHMKKTGVNSLSEKTWTVKKVKDFCDKFSKKYSKTKLTYSPIVIVARLV